MRRHPSAQTGETVGVESLTGGVGEALRRWLELYAQALGVEVLVSDDNDSYGVATEKLGIEHQVCVAHARKYVVNRPNPSWLRWWESEASWISGGTSCEGT